MRVLHFSYFLFLLFEGTIGSPEEIENEELEFHSLVANDTGNGNELLNSTVYETTTDVAPSEATGDEIEVLRAKLYEFTNFTSGSFNVAQVLSRLSALEENVRMSTLKFGATQQDEVSKLRQLNAISKQISDIKAKLSDFEEKLGSLATGVKNLGRTDLAHGDGTFPLESSTERQTAWATLFTSSGHYGRTTVLDFRNCGAYEDCCMNLRELDDDTQSINTHGTCVRMYEDRDCLGDFREFYPGSRVCHADFGPFRNKLSSGKPCTTTGHYTACVPD